MATTKRMAHTPKKDLTDKEKLSLQKSLTAQAEANAEKAKADAEIAKSNAEKAIAEAEKAKAEANKMEAPARDSNAKNVYIKTDDNVFIAEHNSTPWKKRSVIKLLPTEGMERAKKFTQAEAKDLIKSTGLVKYELIKA